MNDEFLNKAGWTTNHVTYVKERVKQLHSVDLPLTATSVRFLSGAFTAGVYRHYRIAMEQFLAGANVCLTTGTESGIGSGVGGIDGQTPMASRLDILKRSRVLILTSDVVSLEEVSALEHSLPPRDTAALLHEPGVPRKSLP
jgi:hypothetical protein